MAGPRGTRLSRVVPRSPTRNTSCAAPHSLSLDGHGGGHTPPPPLRHPLATVGYAASPTSPSPHRRCSFAASPAPRPRIWERTGRLPLDPASPSARPLERWLLPRLSLVKQQLIAPSSHYSHPVGSNDGRSDAADLLGSRADKRWSARLVSFPAASRPGSS